ncbi:MAG: CDP-diacylglycerol--glycerol-3-phosphate 3-phosphatidyltransferase [Oscillospiraceae bacterium]|jgi:CDP-diacylglycerol--glycerol-3-phosphate 3-phosphatidyltransferase|nr:CDP-diacylglycerol--glycerol-3-phosphate 3-phosphatidyltransferase [Oscillospiraceae bacterium]
MSVANILTLARIALIPFFLVSLSYDWGGSLAAPALFLAASLTDSLDGFIARKYNQITTFGKLIDPLADKLLICSAVLWFTREGVLPVWVAMIILARDFIVTSLRLVAIEAGKVVSAHFSGKLRTLLNTFFLMFFLLQPRFFSSWPLPTINTASASAMAAVSAWSCADYLYKNRAVINIRV